MLLLELGHAHPMLEIRSDTSSSSDTLREHPESEAMAIGVGLGTT
jgi:hypothetical protein